MKLAFTICSANYLPFAKALGDSLLRHNSDYVFKIVLLDDFAADRNFFLPHQVIPITEMRIDGFAEMNNRYTIFELSCALKPFASAYFFHNDPSVDHVVYFDSDILVFGSLAELNKQLVTHAIVITPHITTPITDDGLFPKEETIMRSGIYNAGFFAVSRQPETFRFLQWWSEHMRTKCHKDVLNGLFDDQIWLNLVPVFFKNVLVFLDLGYNAAYWNMHERQLEWDGQAYRINNQFPLVVFHFSGYDINKPELISKYQDRYSFKDKAEWLPLYQEYVAAAVRNNLNAYQGIQSRYGAGLAQPKKKKFFKRLFG
jgi:lipopolysaccharide biosynthesis glycosyltransferase